MDETRDRSTTDGFHWTCKTCSRDPVRRRKVERRRTIRHYGLTREEFDDLRMAQGNRCAICQCEFVATPHIDHDHGSGEVRGLLCRECNIALGLFEDDPRRLEAAVAYLVSGGTAR